ncbi:MAG: thioredoxin domain-containing protein [Nitrospirota bacterium]
MTSPPRHSNRLVHETSPYLLQHAHNPVDWYPWGEEAFAKARAEHKPVLLSIGYSACHWCHVMEHESFEDEDIAALMNRHFVNIKVDREERPDLDQIYQTAFQVFNRRGGGWPLTMFLTPDGKPFHAGTYFPPEDRHGMPGFPRVIEAVATAYRDKAQDLAHTGEQAVAILDKIETPEPADGVPGRDLIASAAESLTRLFEPMHGGFGTGPKFPSTMALELFIRHARASGDTEARRRAAFTLQMMAAGGIYDQLGGGFHRYSVDGQWLVPHFEKMLYDNALLIPLALDLFQASGDADFARVARETADYLLREMRHPGGGFFSTQDADSEGHEGKFFVWTPEEIERVLGPEDAKVFCRAYGVTERGNFEGRTILRVMLREDALAVEFNRPIEEVRAKLAASRSRLFAARETRVKPFRDEKILTSWNGLAISALARAGAALDEPRYVGAAEDAVAFIARELWRDGRLLRTWKDGRAKLNGYLDDYTFLANALIDVYEATGTLRHLEWARELTDTVLAQFWAQDGRGLHVTSHDHEVLVTRPLSGADQSIPSGSSQASFTLLRLAAYLGVAAYRDFAERLFTLSGRAMEDNPFGYANLLCALDLYHEGTVDVVIIGPRGHADARALLRAVHGSYLPNRTLTVTEAERADGAMVPEAARGKPLRDGRPTAYVCRRFTCSAPLTDPAALRALLASA